MVTITRQVFTNIFQMEHFSAVTFTMGYEKKKKRAFLWYQNLQKFEKKNEKMGLGSFKGVLHPNQNISMGCALSPNYQHFFAK